MTSVSWDDTEEGGRKSTTPRLRWKRRNHFNFVAGRSRLRALPAVIHLLPDDIDWFAKVQQSSIIVNSGLIVLIENVAHFVFLRISYYRTAVVRRRGLPVPRATRSRYAAGCDESQAKRSCLTVTSPFPCPLRRILLCSKSLNP